MAVLNHLVTALATILLITPSLASTSPKDLAKVAAQFKTAGIVPDVLPRFNPSALAYLTFVYPNSTSSTITSPGLRIGRDDAQLPPVLSIQGLSDHKRYVGVVVDPDAPSRADPTRRSIRHYLAPDLSLGQSSVYVGDAKVLVNATAAANDFRGPNPPAGSGPHRYVFLLYVQPAGFEYSFLDLADRAGFNLSGFAERTGMGDPVAGTYFLTEVV
ncbi:hypothetical protein Q9L58_000256 [Maublancomyces gigas]|uniref:PEBP-like protein n=1 Tax=Discina gigas TaxID=1032678 RepID=A0ABR3GXB6_9PEZI